MKGWSVGSGPSSATAEAAYTAPAGRVAILKGVHVTPQTGTTAVAVTMRVGNTSAATTAVTLGYTTGPFLRAESVDGLVKGKYIVVDATSNLGTSFVNVFMWGSLE
jgi:hypothetical protein